MDYDQAASCHMSLAQWAHVRIACAKLKQSQLFERDAFTELNDALNILFIFFKHVLSMLLVKTSIIRTFRLSEHPSVPMRSDK